MLRFLKKLWEITASLSFTFAGSAVLLITLSGDTQEMAMIATACAIFVHYVHELTNGE